MNAENNTQDKNKYSYPSKNNWGTFDANSRDKYKHYFTNDSQLTDKYKLSDNIKSY